MSAIILDSSTFCTLSVSSEIGSEKVPILKVRFCFSLIEVVNAKFACVNPPPSTSCKPTNQSEKVPSPEAGTGQVNFCVAINLLY